MVEYTFLWIERFVWDPLGTFTGPKAWKMRFPGPPAMSDQDGLNHIFWLTCGQNSISIMRRGFFKHCGILNLGVGFRNFFSPAFWFPISACDTPSSETVQLRGRMQ